MVTDYKSKGVALVAISPNRTEGLSLSELGYTDVSDSFEEMKYRAKDKNFNFPYLYDGETQSVSLQYGPAATPHIFIFDKARKLRYQGRIDDMENPKKKPTSFDARNAIEIGFPPLVDDDRHRRGGGKHGGAGKNDESFWLLNQV